MKKPTLDEFIIRAQRSWPRNAHVKEPGFTSLYVRVSRRSLEGRLRPMIDLAEIVARYPGRGTFEPRFSVMLVSRLRFKANPIDRSSYYLLPDYSIFTE